MYNIEQAQVGEDYTLDCSIHPSANWHVQRGIIPKNVKSVKMRRKGKFLNRLMINPAHPINNGNYLCKFEKVVILEIKGVTNYMLTI